jgi:hypothetical protein
VSRRFQEQVHSVLVTANGDWSPRMHSLFHGIPEQAVLAVQLVLNDCATDTFGCSFFVGGAGQLVLELSAEPASEA